MALGLVAMRWVVALLALVCLALSWARADLQKALVRQEALWVRHLQAPTAQKTAALQASLRQAGASWQPLPGGSVQVVFRGSAAQYTAVVNRALAAPGSWQRWSVTTTPGGLHGEIVMKTL